MTETAIAPTMDDGPAIAISSYRYVRIGLVGLVLLILLGVAKEHLILGCFQSSISYYYYTPSRSLFVGALVAIGVSLIALKGTDIVEDTILNLGGICAPLVAFVPTPEFVPTPQQSGTPCPSLTPTLLDVTHEVANNLFAAFILGGTGILLVALQIFRIKTVKKGERAANWIGWFVTSLVLAGFAVWYSMNSSYFVLHAHYFAAGGVFAATAAVAFIYTLRHRRADNSGFALWYGAISLLMAAGGGIMAGFWIADKFSLLFLESWEVLLFGGFWIVQTIDVMKREKATYVKLPLSSKGN